MPLPHFLRPWCALAALGLAGLACTAAPPPAVICDPRVADAADAAGPSGESPLQAFHAHVCGFHFYSGDLRRALRVDHYCSPLNAEFLQCVLYDSNRKNARLIGVEYVISERLFNRLPAAEKKLWHSHRFEVQSGQLTAPDLSAVAEQALMKNFVNTYGKTWQLWQVDRGDELPLGLPQLMMGFTAEGQLDPALVAARDRDLHLDAAALQARRAEIAAHPVAAGADAWQTGPAFQIEDARLPAAPPAAPR